MQAIHFPRIQYPFPSFVNRSAEAANEQNYAWAQHFHLIRTAEADARFRKARFAWLAARAFPNAGFNELCIIANFNTWLFLLDDQCDEARLGKSADQLRHTTGRFMEVFHQNLVLSLSSGGYLAAALSDIWQRMRQISSPAWQVRFIRSMEEYFASCHWEANNRAMGLVPPVADYVIMRPYTGALFADLEAIEIIEKVYLPESVLQHAMVQRLGLACNNIVCWANDLMSCNKEARQGDVHNLVLALMHERKHSLEEAMREAIRMHDDEVRLFAALEKLLPSFDAATDRELARYIAVLRSWITGNYDWSVLDTGRYRTEAVPVPEEA